MITIEQKAHQFNYSLPESQRATKILAWSNGFMDHASLTWTVENKQELLEVEFNNLGIEWAWHGPEETDFEGGDFDFGDEFPKEFYDCLNKLLEPKCDCHSPETLAAEKLYSEVLAQNKKETTKRILAIK